MLFITMSKNEFVFTGIIYKEGDRYSALCTELDVASEGDTVEETSENLLEAVTLYLEAAIEGNLPYLRPILLEEDPRKTHPESIAQIFRLKVDFQIKVHA
jgi:predicted RNase H-like HicB family nuclease